jgi:hypothetical protein
VLVKLSKWLLVVTLSLSIGLHWTVLQSVAWCGMVITYSQGASLKEGLAKTFDGRHPCKLCKMVAEGKNSEKKQDAQLKISKTDLFSNLALKALFIPPTILGIFPPGLSSGSRTESPLTPPPRFA